ncbi:MAG: hypothetical protein JWO12_2464 [Frankiales bacterium]|nr:hypothetical protein [Frankiales bacterium]
MQPEGYGPPVGYVPPPGYPPVQRVPGTNGFAIASLVCSLAGFAWGVTAVLGVVFGHVARSQIRQTGQGGGGLALAGLIIGYAFLALFAFVLLVIVLFVGSFAFWGR